MRVAALVSRDPPAPWLCYAMAPFTVGLALSVRAGLEPYATPGDVPLFIAAIAFTAWYGGLGAGILASLLSVVSIAFLELARPGESLLGEGVRLLLFCAVASLTSGLIHARRRSQDHLTRSTRRVERLQEITNALARALSRDQVADVVIEHVLSTLEGTFGAVALLSKDGRALNMLRSVGYSEETRTAWHTFAVDDSTPMGLTVRTGELVLLPDRAEAAGRFPHVQEELSAAASWAMIPLCLDERVIGSIAVGWPRQVAFPEEDVALMLTMAAQCAQAIERARLYDIEQDARRQAERASRMKDEFLATISHELRTPLTAVLGWARLLREGRIDDGKQQRALETIERNAKVQAQLVEDLLDVSRIITGKLRLDLRPVDLRGIAEAAIEVVRPTVEAKRIHLLTTLGHEPVVVAGDPDRLQQVLWNLLSNAIKFTPPGGCVEFRLAITRAQALVSVRDTGQGISPDFLPYVFDRFRQADSSMTRVHGGLGLGLALVRHLTELHGGIVRAQSDGESRGSTFMVELPVANERAATPLPQPRPLPDPQALDGLRVLVVDDEAESLEVLTTVLVQFGAEVKGSASAGDAFEQMQTWRPDVLLSDIAMPGEDGYTLIRRIRALEPERGGTTPAAAITAFASEEDRVRALSAGYQTHLPKPFEPSVLASVVTDLARRPLRRSPVAAA